MGYGGSTRGTEGLSRKSGIDFGRVLQPFATAQKRSRISHILICIQ